MSRKLIKQIRVEIEMIDILLNRHPDLLEKCRTTTPSQIETDALATLVHSFYNGIENIFKRVAIHLDGGPPHGEDSHKRLLESMTLSNIHRNAVISKSLYDILKDYMDFRHFFRHAYIFSLEWNRLSPHVARLNETFNQLKTELEQFIASIKLEDSV